MGREQKEERGGPLPLIFCHLSPEPSRDSRLPERKRKRLLRRLTRDLFARMDFGLYLSVRPRMLMKNVDFTNRQRLKISYLNYLMPIPVYIKVTAASRTHS